jgi:hypothetical protein
MRLYRRASQAARPADKKRRMRGERESRRSCSRCSRAIETATASAVFRTPTTPTCGGGSGDVVAGLAAVSTRPVNLNAGRETQRINVGLISDN